MYLSYCSGVIEEDKTLNDAAKIGIGLLLKELDNYTKNSPSEVTVLYHIRAHSDAVPQHISRSHTKDKN
jgi:hypothetical protein